MNIINHDRAVAWIRMLSHHPPLRRHIRIFHHFLHAHCTTLSALI
jgi:hypothetical protein